jgi:acyl-homoserine-lactone acylase
MAGYISESEPLQGFGDAWVIVIEFSKPVRAYSVLAYGQTTNPTSKHSRDQIGLFANHELKPVWFTESEIKANLESEYHP